ncbi:RsbT co-antagonist protein RsbRB [Priestia endophytica]|uniref:STAS domain-containing protein n=1 Tax=Priestia endophytica TaxID=135735 RepID=UPI000DCA8F31|nr:STAS domain-containing protein [Priestia endophytica]RAS91588.1 RsbT co-antagonist protein RsbRB [Priestia endophytica]
MYRNDDLYNFLLERTWDLTENWYADLDKVELGGVYASTDLVVVETLKKQNHEFHKRFCKLFSEESDVFYEGFEEWVIEIAKDEEHARTPIHLILQEFFNVQTQYIQLINEFASQYKDKYSLEEINQWKDITTKAFNKVIMWFTEESHKYSESRLKAQQEMINELSSPIISLTKHVALLPLVGDIDTARAKFILDSTLTQCTEREIHHLLVDLSGVVMIDTMVAQQLFQLIETLHLIGVTSTFSGIRPEIAQTAVQLGINFNRVSIVSTLEQAVKLKDLETLTK